MHPYLPKKLFVLLSILCSQLLFAQSTALKGKITNAITNENLEGATVILVNTSYHAITSSNGYFEIKSVKSGNYTVQINFIGFKSVQKKIDIKEGETVELNIKMSSASKELEEVYIFNRIDKEQESGSRSSEKNATNLINVISARAMERSPDINAANVLQRMSGVTLQKSSGADESYAIIRGLEPRYSNTLINGIKITSPDEKSRYVSLDIVPSDLLQKIEVSKSLLPEMEADAIGGTVNLVMKDAPDSLLFKALGSIGYNKLLLDRRYDYFYISDIQQRSVYDKNGSNYTAQPNDFTRTNLDFRQKNALPTTILGTTFGQRFLKGKLGVLVADNFQNQYYGSNSEFNIVQPDTHNSPVITDVANRSSSTQQLNNGLTIHIDYVINPKNKIILNNVSLYSYLSQARLSVDTSIMGGNGGRIGLGTGSIFNVNRSLTTHEYLENIKLEGRHILNDHLLFDWAGVYSDAFKRSPDRAEISIDHKINADYSSTPYYFDDISRIWQHNNDQDYEALGNLTFKSKVLTQLLEVKIGSLYRHKIRNNNQDEYILRPVANGGTGIKQVYTDIYSAQWTVYNARGTADYDINNYQAYEDITAGYGQFKINTKKLDISGGVRIESTDQGFHTNNFIPTAIDNVKKSYTDVLPSVQLKYKLNLKSNIRASYFKSISRPNYYELVPATIKGVDYDQQGNPDLLHSVADNFDLRYELFPRDEEQVFISGFYKRIQDPIEYAFASSGRSTQFVYMPQNFGDAKVWGVELVFTRYFGKIGVTGNYTYLISQINSPKLYSDTANHTSTPRLQERPMQGQTDHTLNLSLLYKNDNKKIFIQLAYEFLGKTLFLVSPIYGLDYNRQPQSFLALSGEKQLTRHFTFFGKLNNLLNTPSTIKIGGLIAGKDIYKASFSVGLRYSK